MEWGTLSHWSAMERKKRSENVTAGQACRCLPAGSSPHPSPMSSRHMVLACPGSDFRCLILQQVMVSMSRLLTS
jgi:hypothetical protein